MSHYRFLTVARRHRPAIPRPRCAYLTTASPTATPAYSSDVSAAPSKPAIQPEWERRLSQALHAINHVTGYTEIEDRKRIVQEKDSELELKRRLLEETKRGYESSIEERRKCQREINSLLQRKDAWIDTDVIRFTELYRKDLSLEQTENTAKAAYKAASEDFDRSHIDFLNQIRERYIEEQLFSDKIRKASTWWTMGLISIHLTIFILLNLREPWKRRKEQEQLAELLTGITEAETKKLVKDIQATIRPLALTATTAAGDVDALGAVEAGDAAAAAEDNAVVVGKGGLRVESLMASLRELGAAPRETVFGAGIATGFVVSILSVLIANKLT